MNEQEELVEAQATKLIHKLHRLNVDIAALVTTKGLVYRWGSYIRRRKKMVHLLTNGAHHIGFVTIMFPNTNRMEIAAWPYGSPGGNNDEVLACAIRKLLSVVRKSVAQQ